MALRFHGILVLILVFARRVLADTEPGSIILPMSVVPMSACYSEFVTNVYPSAWYVSALIVCAFFDSGWRWDVAD